MQTEAKTPTYTRISKTTYQLDYPPVLCARPKPRRATQPPSHESEAVAPVRDELVRKAVDSWTTKVDVPIGPGFGTGEHLMRHLAPKEIVNRPLMTHIGQTPIREQAEPNSFLMRLNSGAEVAPDTYRKDKKPGSHEDMLEALARNERWKSTTRKAMEEGLSELPQPKPLCPLTTTIEGKPEKVRYVPPVHGTEIADWQTAGRTWDHVQARQSISKPMVDDLSKQWQRFGDYGKSPPEPTELERAADATNAQIKCLSERDELPYAYSKHVVGFDGHKTLNVADTQLVPRKTPARPWISDSAEAYKRFPSSEYSDACKNANRPRIDADVLKYSRSINVEFNPADFKYGEFYRYF